MINGKSGFIIHQLDNSDNGVTSDQMAGEDCLRQMSGACNIYTDFESIFKRIYIELLIVIDGKRRRDTSFRRPLSGKFLFTIINGFIFQSRRVKFNEQCVI